MAFKGGTAGGVRLQVSVRAISSTPQGIGKAFLASAQRHRTRQSEIESCALVIKSVFNRLSSLHMLPGYTYQALANTSATEFSVAKIVLGMRGSGARSRTMFPDLGWASMLMS